MTNYDVGMLFFFGILTGICWLCAWMLAYCELGVQMTRITDERLTELIVKIQEAIDCTQECLADVNGSWKCERYGQEQGRQMLAEQLQDHISSLEALLELERLRRQNRECASCGGLYWCPQCDEAGPK